MQIARYQIFGSKSKNDVIGYGKISNTKRRQILHRGRFFSIRSVNLRIKCTSVSEITLESVVIK